jgi:hypothetical protein
MNDDVLNSISAGIGISPDELLQRISQRKFGMGQGQGQGVGPQGGGQMQNPQTQQMAAIQALTEGQQGAMPQLADVGQGIGVPAGMMRGGPGPMSKAEAVASTLGAGSGS